MANIRSYRDWGLGLAGGKAAGHRDGGARGIRLVTLLDDDYPANLRRLPHPPPLLFCRGQVLPGDAWAVAVVGTSTPTPDGLRRARRFSSSLARGGVTVVSGLARGIDTAAHEAALDASGRTVAVLGCGIRRVHPPENAGLAERIAARGAVVSQFLPDTPPSAPAFRLRNAVSAGLALASLVVEAGPMSGARLQARLSLEQGRPVLLPAGLVAEQEWTAGLLPHPGVHVVDDDADAGCLMECLRSTPDQAGDAPGSAQLALALEAGR
ncbi:MAG: DNA-processing protein DprA [Candidatus Dormibacteria bacterium]|jgi:DNA processing protein